MCNVISDVSVTSSGLKWQSDTERREHWGEASGRRRRITVKYFTMIMMVTLQRLCHSTGNVTFDDYILSVSFLLNAVIWMTRR